MPLPGETLYTIDDIYHLPEGKRAELIDGHIYYMSPPSTSHQRILSFLHLSIGRYIQDNQGDCEVIPAPFAVFINEQADNYVEPDLSIICDRNKINDKGCNGAPDWIIEIVSPGSRRMDYLIKLFKYRSAGVREYWIVDPQKHRITTYNFEAEDTAEYDMNDKVTSVIFPALSIDFSKLNMK